MTAVNLVMVALIGIIIITLFIYILLGPMRLLWKLIINSLFGVLLLLLTNFIGSYFAFMLPINLATVLIAGFLGIPGILLLAGFKLLV